MKNIKPAKITLTIFTPAYNRANLLPRLFDSIASQVEVSDTVEWLIINDGSTDDTERVLENFVLARPDLVRYFCVENGGKHRAINQAAQRARGDWIMIVDSDDRLTSNAVASMMDAIKAVENDSRVGVLRALRLFPELSGSRCFNVSPNPGRHTDWLAAQPSFDTAEVIRKTALCQYPFPEYAGERFMAESWLWHSLDKTHLTFFINTAWVECFYQPNGLTANNIRIRVNSPKGAMAVYLAMLHAEDLPVRFRARASINWWRYWFCMKSYQKRSNKNSCPSYLYWPIGLLFYLRDVIVLRLE